MTVGTRTHREVLRRLAINDSRFVASILTGRAPVTTAQGPEAGHRAIDDRTRRLVELAALIAVGSGSTSIDAAVSAAFGAGAEPDEIVEVLLAISPDVGAARVVDAAPHIAAALGYDLDADLEMLDAGERPSR